MATLALFRAYQTYTNILNTSERPIAIHATVSFPDISSQWPWNLSIHLQPGVKSYLQFSMFCYIILEIVKELPSGALETRSKQSFLRATYHEMTLLQKSSSFIRKKVFRIDISDNFPLMGCFELCLHERTGYGGLHDNICKLSKAFKQWNFYGSYRFGNMVCLNNPGTQ